MTAAQRAKAAVQPSMLRTVVECQTHTTVVKWDDEGGRWWRTFPVRLEKTQQGLGSTLYRFVTAYIAAVVSGCEDPGDLGASCKAIADDLKRPDGGEVPMSAVISSFQKCPANLFFNTLALLKWAGHVKKLSTLHKYKFAVMWAVKSLIADQARNIANPANRVRTFGSTCVEV